MTSLLRRCVILLTHSLFLGGVSSCDFYGEKVFEYKVINPVQSEMLGVNESLILNVDLQMAYEDGSFLISGSLLFSVDSVGNCTFSAASKPVIINNSLFFIDDYRVNYIYQENPIQLKVDRSTFYVTRINFKHKTSSIFNEIRNNRELVDLIIEEDIEDARQTWSLGVMFNYEGGVLTYSVNEVNQYMNRFNQFYGAASAFDASLETLEMSVVEGGEYSSRIVVYRD